MRRDVILPDEDRELYEQFHFGPAVRAGHLLLCAGQIGMDSEGGVPDEPEDEFRNAWRGVGRVLEKAGLGYENIVEYTTYHVGLHAHLEAFMAVRDEFLRPPWPAWTAIGISELAVPGARVEIRVIAASSATP